MGDNELIKDYSSCGIMLQTFARQVNLEAQKQDLLAKIKMTKPWFIDENAVICVDKAISVDDYIPGKSMTLSTMAVRLPSKRNKKHYKPKFTL